MKEITFKVNEEEARHLLGLIQKITQGISAGEIEEAVKGPTAPEEKPEVCMTSREVATIFDTAHSQVFRKISAWLCKEATVSEKKEFTLDTFSIPQGQSYSMYRMSEKACRLYIEKIQTA